MKHLTFRIWSLVTVTPVIVAIIIRIIWELMVNTSTNGLIILIPVILGLLSLYALIACFIVKPNPKVPTSLPVGMGVAILATAGLIGGVIHLTRCIPSPEAGLPWSLVIALIYLLAGTSAYFMLLWIIWSNWKSGENQG